MNKSKPGKIAKVERVPFAFAPLAKAINDLIDQQAGGAGQITPKSPLELTVGNDGRAILEIDIAELSRRLARDPKARAGGGGGDADLEARVAALESRLSGYGPRVLDVCITGVVTSVTFFTK